MNYKDFFQDIQILIEKSQLKAITTVNTQLLEMYWQLGKRILEIQEKQEWGAKVIDNLSKDLKISFPKLKGFSVRNLKYMKKFAETYPNFEFVQALPAQLSWTHHITLFNKISDQKIRMWYILKAAEQNWTYRVLEKQIKAKVHENFGSLPNNFEEYLPEPQSDLAKDIFKDDYIFDFIGQSEVNEERDLENSLTKYISDFLLALGKGFAFIGSQYHIEVARQDFYVDMLFYHVHLHCYIVVELKTEAFKPEFAGKLNFYLSAVDSVIKQKEDNPTLGLLLCEYKNDLIVEFALRDVHKPMGVASYQLTKQLPENLQNNLPTEEELKLIFKEIKRKKK